MEATLRFTVGEHDTAAALGSGDLPVLGTPRLLAWCEATTCAAIASVVQPGSTSVGTHVDLHHVAPSPVGAAVQVTAREGSHEGRSIRFEVEAVTSPGERLVGRGEITRAIVDRAQFLSRLE